MIITKLIGGLGSQMFRYSFGRQLSIANKTILKLDIAGFEKDKVNTPRKFELDTFNIQAHIATEKEIKYFQKFEKKRGKLNILHNFLFADEKKYIKEKKFTFDETCISTIQNAYLNGNWLSEKYFKNIRNIILEDFTPKSIDDYSLKILDHINRVNSISVHFRRGDHVTDEATNRHHGVCPLEYYHKAIELISRKINNPVFFIFSDDPEWVKNNFKINFQTEYVNQPGGEEKDYQDLFLMSKCKHNIIANSTFSWWGAWLNQNPGKIVCSPKKWFNVNRDINDLIPKSWITI